MFEFISSVKMVNIHDCSCLSINVEYPSPTNRAVRMFCKIIINGYYFSYCTTYITLDINCLFTVNKLNNEEFYRDFISIHTVVRYYYNRLFLITTVFLTRNLFLLSGFSSLSYTK